MLLPSNGARQPAMKPDPGCPGSLPDCWPARSYSRFSKIILGKADPDSGDFRLSKGIFWWREATILESETLALACGAPNFREPTVGWVPPARSPLAPNPSTAPRPLRSATAPTGAAASKRGLEASKPASRAPHEDACKLRGNWDRFKKPDVILTEARDQSRQPLGVYCRD